MTMWKFLCKAALIVFLWPWILLAVYWLVMAVVFIVFYLIPEMAFFLIHLIK